MNYEQDIQIDESSLDVEWLGQATLMMKYTKNSAMAFSDLDQTKEALDIVRAGIDLKIRNHPEEFGLEKTTEAAIQNTILLDKKYQEVNKVYLDARYEFEMAKGAVRAFEQRKDALENLVRLHGQQYFAGPKVPRDLAWEVEERQKRIDAKVKIVRRTK